MAAHKTITLANGHTLTLIAIPGSIFAVQERNELGTFLATAFTTPDRAEGLRWLDRAQTRGYGLRPTTGPKTRELAAELAILEEYDATRSRLGHDYGSGQRHAELSRRRRELDSRLSLVSRSAPLRDEPSAGELVAAFERVGRPRLSRLRTEGYRAHTPATSRTRRAWEIVERWVGVRP